jgi:hypothetical protein
MAATLDAVGIYAGATDARKNVATWLRLLCVIAHKMRLQCRKTLPFQ